MRDRPSPRPVAPGDGYLEVRPGAAPDLAPGGPSDPPAVDAR